MVCRQLGYVKATRATLRAEFGEGLGDILKRNVECVGTENSLSHCESREWDNGFSCRHYEDAGVVCEGMYMYTDCITCNYIH